MAKALVWKCPKCGRWNIREIRRAVRPDTSLKCRYCGRHSRLRQRTKKNFQYLEHKIIDNTYEALRIVRVIEWREREGKT